jgi:putative DNA primase/helicase
MNTVAEDHAAIGSRWPDVLAHLVGDLPTKKKPGPCPVCGGSDRFFFDNRHGRGDWHCRHCDPPAGDGFDLVMRVRRWDLNTARERVLDALGMAARRSIAPARPASSYRPYSDIAMYLWEEAQPTANTIVEAYLRGRGCRLPPEDGDLRYLPARGAHPAAMLGRVTDAVTSEPISLHFTALDADGRKVGDQPKRLLAGHRKAGGVIRLWPDECVTSGLAIAEGIESALAAAHGFTPVWAAIDAGNLAALPVVAGIEALTIVADHDEAGIRAARECARRWTNTGRQVRIAIPRTPGEDAADVAAAPPKLSLISGGRE